MLCPRDETELKIEHTHKIEVDHCPTCNGRWLDHHELDLLEAELHVTVVRAPFAGVIVSEHVAEGEWITAGGTTFELVDTKNLELALEVPEARVFGIDPGARVSNASRTPRCWQI